jgi:hypothetical protein
MDYVTIICDSWTGPMGISIMNFMVYCNAIMFFHKSVDCTRQLGCGLHIQGTYHASKTFCCHVCQVVTYGVYMLC